MALAVRSEVSFVPPALSGGLVTHLRVAASGGVTEVRQPLCGFLAAHRGAAHRGAAHRRAASLGSAACG